MLTEIGLKFAACVDGGGSKAWLQICVNSFHGYARGKEAGQVQKRFVALASERRPA
jgi:hypothetical protein